jgi:hypothetical protein
MGGVGSGNWYRFDKKSTTGECHSVDVRYLYRESLLTPGHWFSLRWSRAGRETGSIRGAVTGAPGLSSARRTSSGVVPSGNCVSVMTLGAYPASHLLIVLREWPVWRRISRIETPCSLRTNTLAIACW